MRRSLTLTLLAAVAAAGCSSTDEAASTPEEPVSSSAAAVTTIKALDNAGTGPGGANSAVVATAVIDMLAMLGAGQRAEVVHDITDDRGRQTWSDHAAAQVPREGIAYDELSGVQRAAVMVVLDAALSDDGYGQVTATMPADAHLAVYGTPSATEPFVIQLGGSHLARNLTYHGDQVSMTPSLTGTDSIGAKAAQQVYNALSDQEKIAAQLSSGVSDDLVKGPGQDDTDYPAAEGLLVSELSDAVQSKVTALIAAHTGDLDKAAGDKLLAAYRSEYAETRVAWTDSYLRVDGPRVWIEVLGDVSIFRDKANDYGSS
ncbi:hypothetical protein FB565_007979 [Actinoplanes lutulentus]|uniref:Uncharacterized protein DUF3500 n=1 Tax=Actinoplanes lutulentus TaxID=1287878 RepID=A0A327Z6D4_9ACTN|nr:DUF3500 domain-containing protein [Actinoplanes lutulentus]MBB2948196.1 hypothetical protein [Actinoplanes lutulentus]RAK31304.1 uncharacterized protein DUF3500 [Actinoplanes lutulentus]